MEVVKEYINYIKDKKKLSNNTVLSYYTDIKKYMDYLKSINLEVSDVVENDIIGYIISLEKDSVSVMVHGYYNSNMCSDKSVDGAQISVADYYWISTDIKPAK